MILISDLLIPERIACKQQVSSKKKALQIMSELLGTRLHIEELSQMDFLDALIGREKLGSTGLGHGVALPHGRITGLDVPLGAMITLDNGIDYDAPDQQPVDLLFGLVVPERCNEEHLAILAMLAKTFSSDSLRQRLRATNTPDALLEILLHSGADPRSGD